MNGKIEGKIRIEEDGWVAKSFAKKYVLKEELNED
jgi:hypothetical protein